MMNFKSQMRLPLCVCVFAVVTFALSASARTSQKVLPGSWVTFDANSGQSEKAPVLQFRLDPTDEESSVYFGLQCGSNQSVELMHFYEFDRKAMGKAVAAETSVRIEISPIQRSRNLATITYIASIHFDEENETYFLASFGSQSISNDYLKLFGSADSIQISVGAAKLTLPSTNYASAAKHWVTACAD